MKFGIEKCAMLIMERGKRQIIKGIELLNQEKSECLGKGKLTSTCEYWKNTQSNKQ